MVRLEAGIARRLKQRMKNEMVVINAAPAGNARL